MSDKKFFINDLENKEGKEILRQEMPILGQPIIFSEEQKKLIHTSAIVAAQLTNFSVEAFEESLYSNFSPIGPDKRSILKELNDEKNFNNPIKHPSGTSFSSDGIVNPEIMRIVNELNSLPSSPNVSVAEMKEAFKKVNGMKDGGFKNEEGP